MAVGWDHCLTHAGTISTLGGGYQQPQGACSYPGCIRAVFGKQQSLNCIEVPAFLLLGGWRSEQGWSCRLINSGCEERGCGATGRQAPTSPRALSCCTKTMFCIS